MNLFVDDFLAASAILGKDEDELENDPIAVRSWDGHQVSVGAQVAVTDAVAVRGAVVGYLFSESHRDPGLGDQSFGVTPVRAREARHC